MSESSPVIKRATRTYGRSKAPRADSSFDADTSFGQPTLLLDTSSGSLDISDIADAPPSSDYDVSFGSLPGDDDDNDASMEGGDILPTAMKFMPIRERLRRLEEEMDELDSRADHSDGSRLEANKATLERLQPLFGKDPVPERSGASPLHTLTHSATLESTQRPSHTPRSSHESSPSASRSPSPITVPGRKKRLPVALDSDSEQELPQRSSSPHTSPGTFQINTPPGRPSPTPPTSSEMTSRKGKGKEVLRPIAGIELEQLDMSENERPQRKTRSQAKGKAREKRVKAPTKKAREDTQKATARMQAERTVTIPRPKPKVLQFSDLMQKVVKPTTHPKPGHEISSDPIESFSPAPPRSGPSRLAPIVQFHTGRTSSRALTPEQKPDTSRGHNVSFEIPQLSDDDEELPDTKDVFGAQIREREQAKRKKELRIRKLQLLEQQQREAVIASRVDSSSDLEVEETMNAVVKEEAEERRRSKMHKVKTPVRKRKSYVPDALSPEKQEAFLVAAARSSFIRDTGRDKGAQARANNSRFKQNDLNRVLLGKIEQERKEIIEQKESEWLERGGSVMPRPDVRERADEVLKAKMAELAAKGLSLAQRIEPGDEEVEETDEEDGDWMPNTQALEDDDPQNPFVAPDNEDEDTEFDDENAPPPKLKHRILTVVDSDEENAPPPSAPTGRVLVPNSSLVFLESPPPRLESSDKENANIDTEAENETDKENDASLMFDRGEDKENTAIASSQSSIPQPLFGLSSRNSFSSLDGVDLATSSPTPRSPLKPISGLDDDDDDDPFMSTPAPRSSKKSIRSPDFFSPSRRMPDPADDDAGPSSQNDSGFSLEPAANIKVGFSQFMAAGKSSSDFSPAPALAGSLKTQFSQFVTPAKPGNGFDKLRQQAKGGDLSLTLAPVMQASLDVTDSTRKKAEAIFEKEQEFVVQDAVTKPGKSSQLFLNQHGFYTQTDPSLTKTPGLDFSSPAADSQGMFRPSSPLLQSVLRSKSKARAPLGTIDLAEEEEIPRPRRLMKRAHTPEVDVGGYRSSPSPSPSRTRNAFNLLMQTKPKIPRPKMVKSAFVEGEAEESDEDAIFGFGPKVKHDSDEEEDGEDQDATLQELVDDKDMDADTLNEDKVLEKVKEHQELDDAELERIHREAVTGKMRAKRRDRGIGFEDSDSDDEDDENARRRQKIAKKRRLDGGDSLDQLAKDKATQAFVESYNAGLPDDDLADFAHLQNEDEEVIIPQDTQMDEDDEDDDDDDDDEEEYRPEEVSIRDVHDEVRKVAAGEMTIQELDPEDVSWMDNEDSMDVEDEPIRIKEVSHQAKRPTRSADADPFDFGVGIRTVKPSAGLTQHTKWANKARAEGVNGTGRGSSAITVTGHSISTKSKSKTGGGSIAGRGGSSSASASTLGGGRGKKNGTLTKTASALSAVSGRRERFGN